MKRRHKESKGGVRSVKEAKGVERRHKECKGGIRNIKEA